MSDSPPQGPAKPVPSIAPWLAVIALALVGAGWYLTRPADPATPAGVAAGWTDDLGAAMTAAAGDGKPVLVRFTAEWCPPCKQMDAEVYARPAIADTLTTRTHPVVIDLTDPGAYEQEVAGTYGVQSIPTTVLLDADGRELDRLVGGADASRFVHWLNRHTATP